MKLGLEVLLDGNPELVGGDRIGLITNPSGFDHELRWNIDRFDSHPDIDLRVLFGPEHGLRGSEQAGDAVNDSTDDRTGLPIKSLYSDTRHLKPNQLHQVDTLVFDMQDVGCRFYTYIYTLANSLYGVSEAGKRLVVLDRPNPISPLGLAGNRIQDSFTSYIGGYELPLMHAMTVGELAQYLNEEFNIDAELEIVTMRDWNHSLWYDDTDLPDFFPSPNLPTLKSAIVYPGTGLFEGTNISEGRGTTRPFELIGAPWISAWEWAETLNQEQIPGVKFRPVYFSPTFSKHEGTEIEGVHVHVEREAVDPVRVGLTMLISAFMEYPQTDWIHKEGKPHIDRLVGGDEVRTRINAVDEGMTATDVYQDIRSSWGTDLDLFAQLRNQYQLYSS